MRDDARLGFAELAAAGNQPREAISLLEQIIQQNPAYSAGYRALAQAHQTFRIESVKEAEYLRQYHELTRGDMQ